MGDKLATCNDERAQTQSLTVQVVKDPASLRQIWEPWDRLAGQATEPNVFYEPWALIPAVEHLNDGDDVCVVLVWSDDRADELLGLFPLCRYRHHRRLPVDRWGTWEHIHCFHCAPLVRSGQEQACFEAFFSWLWRESPAKMFSAMALTKGGALYRELVTFLHDKGITTDQLEQYDRALLETNLSYDAYVRENIRSKKRKEFKRIQRRLSDLGSLQVSQFDPKENHDIEVWTEDFFALEKAGWKGRAGTALACNSPEKHYSEALVRGAGAQGQLLFHRLTLDGRPLAMKLSFRRDRFAFAFKIAYDEAFARYSPGVLLELANMRCALDELNLKWYDSCAVQNHPMIDHLWRERRLMVNVHVTTRRLISRPIVSGMRLAKAARDQIFRKKN